MNPRVVDLGCKSGAAMDEFRKKAPEYYGESARAILPSECLGVDRSSDLAPDVRARGYGFLCLDLTAPGAHEKLPPADFYLAWDFLEHLPGKVWSDTVLAAALEKAQAGVWLRMPNFEQDERIGEGALRRMGLRFAWTHWKGHRSHYLTGDALRAVIPHMAQAGLESIQIQVKPRTYIHTTEDPWVVPIEAPVDTVRYHRDLAPKPVKRFDPPLVGQWDVVVVFRRSISRLPGLAEQSNPELCSTP